MIEYQAIAKIGQMVIMARGRTRAEEIRVGLRPYLSGKKRIVIVTGIASGNWGVEREGYGDTVRGRG